MQDAVYSQAEDRQAVRRRSRVRAGGPILLMAALVSAAAAAPPANQTAAVSPPVTETVVRLHAGAVVSGEDVFLSDVAEVEGEASRLVSGWRIAAAPRPGQSGVLELSRLQSIFAHRGVNLSRWVFRGSSRCEIRRVVDPSRQTEVVPCRAAKEPTHTRMESPAQAPASQPAAQSAVNPDTLEAAVRGHVAGRLAPLAGEPIVRFSAAAGRILALARPTYSFQITDRAEGRKMLGILPLEVSIFEQNQLKQVVPVLAEVSLRKAVVVATRSINRSETIRSGDLQLEFRIFNRIEDIGLTDLRPLIGQRVKRFIDARSILQQRDIEPVPLVMRNDLVTVVARRGGLVIRGSAKAMTSAGIGQAVEVKNESSKETFVAIVIGEKTVEVRPSSAPREAAGQSVRTALASSNSPGAGTGAGE